MLSPTQIFELGKPRSGTALIPFINSTNVTFGITTRSGNAISSWGDGTSNNINTTTGGLNFNKYYASPFTGVVEVKFLNGLKDVFYFEYNSQIGSTSNIHITDIELFFKQFPNLRSIYFSRYTSTIDAVFKGDLSKFPNSAEQIIIGDTRVVNAANDLVLNISNYSILSQLKKFQYNPYNVSDNSSTIKLIGDISKFPSDGQYLYLLKAATGSAITYTAGKVWASAFDTLYLPIRLTSAETDNVFIDANNSVTTAIGGKAFTLQPPRTSASDVAVAGLIAKGFAVNCAKGIEKLILPLSANLLDSSTFSNHATMVGAETHSLSGLQTSTGNYAYIPNKTSLDFGTGSLYFGCKVKFGVNTTSPAKGIIGKSVAAGIVGRYSIFISNGNIYILTQPTSSSSLNVTTIVPLSIYEDSNFHLLEVVCNRTTGKQDFYIDRVLMDTQTFAPNSTNINCNTRFHIGAYGNSTGAGINAGSEFNGVIKDVFVSTF